MLRLLELELDWSILGVRFKLVCFNQVQRKPLKEIIHWQQIAGIDLYTTHTVFLTSLL